MQYVKAYTAATIRLTATGTRVSYRISQLYLLPDRGDVLVIKPQWKLVLDLSTSQV